MRRLFHRYARKSDSQFLQPTGFYESITQCSLDGSRKHSIESAAFSMNDVSELKKALGSPILIDKLMNLNVDTTFAEASIFKFKQLPLFYNEPDHRAVYMVVSSNGNSYILKLNQYCSKIEREYSAFKIIRNSAVQGFSIPDVYAVEIDFPYGDQKTQRCSWILEECVEGQKVQPTHIPHLILTTQTLAYINSTAVDLGDMSKVFSTSIPTAGMLAEMAKREYLNELNRKDLPVPNDTLAQELSKAIEFFENDAFPFMLNLNHGDYHLNNLFLATGEKGNAPTVIDWEDYKIDNPLYDLSHFLFFLPPTCWPLVIECYFDHGRGLFSSYSWCDIAEMMIGISSIWAFRILRWSAKRKNEQAQFNDCCSRVTAHFFELRKLSWKNIIK